jgi:hypothetical protein
MVVSDLAPWWMHLRRFAGFQLTAVLSVPSRGVGAQMGTRGLIADRKIIRPHYFEQTL